jgi:CheY-like chemotaxis protein
MSKPLILVVDDEEYIGELLAELLMDEIECEVVSALNGVRALEVARARPPALIITDLMMPRMNGEALVAALRADSQLSQIPVVAMSAARQKPQWVMEGDIAFLTKPFETDVLVEVVERLLGAEG